MRRSRRQWGIGVLIVAAAVVVAGVIGWRSFTKRIPVHYAADDEHFKYGSIGVEESAGMPYWIWLVLPRMFPEKLPGPGGYASLGMVWEEGRELPVGFTKTTIGVPRVGVNCAACHTTSVRRTPLDKPQLFPGGPAQHFDIQAYQRFLIDCAKDPRFTADAIMKELSYVYGFSFTERLLYRYAIIPATKRGLLDQDRLFAWMNSRPDWGPGRTDMNPFKLMVLKLADDKSVGSADMMAIWNERKHEGMLRHSDGMDPVLLEASHAAALATGATADSMDAPAVQRVSNWLLDVPPPKYPFAIDQVMAAQGEGIFNQNCSQCHAFGSPRVGKVVPLAELGTDPNRAKHWTAQAASEFNRQFAAYSWGFHRFQGDTGGYVALALDGVWARAPYLHNGSVPSLRDLLEPAERRPAAFFRGNDVYDPSVVGFVSDVEVRGGRKFSRFDTTVPGNANGGHLFGTSLSPADKLALIEYLKTL